MALNYKCPNCGAAMIYDAASGHVVCEYCGTTMTADEAENTTEKHDYANEEAEKTEQYSFDDGGQMDVKGYECPNCGAQIMTDDVTAATFCSYCGNPTLIEGRLSNERKPKLVIPFKQTKEQAIGAFKKWTRNGLLTPGDFTSQTTVNKITGIYVPFWLVNCYANCRMEAEGTQESRHSHGDDIDIITKHYRIYRNTLIRYDRIPADASKNMEDDMMDKLEPFDYNELTPFQMSYLSGFYAEKYTYTDEQLRDRIRQRVDDYVKSETRNTIHGYSTVSPISSDVNYRWDKAEYCMIPVWMLNYKYKGKNYSFAMNGQNGRIVGNLPISIGKCILYWAISFVVVLIIALVIGGIIL